jgi:crossover junction endodeoxyribonuclease RuvC
MKAWIGCDPGTAPTFALVSEAGGWLDYADKHKVAAKLSATKWRPVGELMKVVLEGWMVLYDVEGMVIEKVSTMPGQGIASSGEFLAAAAMAEGVAIGLGLRVRRLTPAVWKRTMKLNSDGDMSRAMAARLWPDRAGWLNTKISHNLAEAALLARCGWAIPE